LASADYNAIDIFTIIISSFFLRHMKKLFTYYSYLSMLTGKYCDRSE